MLESLVLSKIASFFKSGNPNVLVTSDSNGNPVLSNVTVPAAGTASQFDNSTNLATTGFVQRALGNFNTAVIKSANNTLTNAAIGSFVELIGSSTFTTTLPAATAVAGGSIVFFNNSSVNQTLALASGTFAGVGYDGVNASTTTIPAGMSLEVVTDAGQWVRIAYYGANLPQPNRNTVQTGPVDSSGNPAIIGVGTGLQPQFIGPANITFADGFTAQGQTDLVSYVSNNSNWPAVPANNISYLSADYLTSTSVNLTSTLARPQIGPVYNQSAQALLHFDGAAGSTTILDDFGNTWTAVGNAKLQSNWSKFGGTALGGGGANNALNGTTDYIKTPLTTLGVLSWSIRGWINITSLASNVCFVSALNTTSGASGYGFEVYISSAGKVQPYLSSNGTSWDIANGPTTGAATLKTNTPAFIEVTFDAVAGKYFCYVNGVLDSSFTSVSPVCPVLQLCVGMGNTLCLPGYVDEFEFLPYCDHPNGTSYSVPTGPKSLATKGYASDWYSTVQGQMYQVTGPSVAAGSNPAMTQVNRVYVGTATAGASTISSAYSYGYNGLKRNGLEPSVTNFATPSLGTSGYQLLPSGLLLQWVNFSGSLTSGTFYTSQPTWPIAFPNAILFQGVIQILFFENNRNTFYSTGPAFSNTSGLIYINSPYTQTFNCTLFSIGY